MTAADPFYICVNCRVFLGDAAKWRTVRDWHSAGKCLNELPILRGDTAGVAADDDDADSFNPVGLVVGLVWHGIVGRLKAAVKR